VPAEPLPEPTLTVDLADGRVASADVVGDRAGRPILYLHGSPDCRLARHPDDGIAAALGVRLIAVDRPGYGRSTPLPGPGPVDARAWAADVDAVLDAVGVDDVAVAAWSAGTPWAFGYAAARPDRVRQVVTYGAVAPLEAMGGDESVAAASGPRTGMAGMVGDGVSVEELADEVASLLVPAGPVDLALARDLVVEAYTAKALAEVESVPGLLDQLARSFAAAVEHHGDAGLRADLTVQFRTGFVEDVLTDVRAPVVAVHGEHDGVAGPAVGAWLVDHLPGTTAARTEVWPFGHQGLLVAWARWLELTFAS
jgi:pimeloyl-ACP methyl ester carboxylesterase